MLASAFQTFPQPFAFESSQTCLHVLTRNNFVGRPRSIASIGSWPYGEVRRFRTLQKATPQEQAEETRGGRKG